VNARAAGEVPVGRRAEAAPARARVPAVLLLAAPLALAIASALVFGISGGLVRAGVDVGGGAWLGAATLFHAALMICGFLGTVIGIERAVAMRAAPAFLAPLSSAAAAVALLAGAPAVARALLVAAALVFVVVNVRLWQRQAAAHTALLCVSALAWLAGNVAFAVDHTGAATLALWFTFLVLTIAAERLEMTRLMRRRPGALASFFVIVALLLAGAALSWPAPRAGGALFGAALAALAVWLLLFDIARRTIFAHGLSRYMAVCLLGGYAWLGAAGVAWATLAIGAGGTEAAATALLRDVALHALGLGFVLAMVMGHAPVILPALARIKVAFGRWFYVPLTLLHGSLLWRFFGGLAGAPDARAQGSALNALALALFVLTMAGAALVWRRTHSSSTRATATRRRAPHP
jgi:hypothetical protein